MSSSHAIPPSVSPEAARLLERAYGLKSREEMLDLYHDWAASYDGTMLDGLGYVSPFRLAELVARHLPDRRSLILDAGCGTGLAALELARRGYSRFHGLDASSDMLATACERGLYEELIETDLDAKLPLPEGAYDAAVSTGTFTHGHVGAGCLGELLRVLKKGGLLACTIHRDVWHAMGFGAALQELTAACRLRPIAEEEGIYYLSSPEPDGRYCLYEKA
jgi:predicted TPR repeat methyltransferase